MESSGKTREFCGFQPVLFDLFLFWFGGCVDCNSDFLWNKKKTLPVRTMPTHVATMIWERMPMALATAAALR